jgi:hypothetical protein
LPLQYCGNPQRYKGRSRRFEALQALLSPLATATWKDLSPALPSRRRFHDETGNCNGHFKQFGGKIGTHQRQKLGAEYQPTRQDLYQVPQVPSYNGSITASHDIYQTGQTTTGAHVSDKLTGAKCHSSLTGKHGFDFAGDEDNHI